VYIRPVYTDLVCAGLSCLALTFKIADSVQKTTTTAFVATIRIYIGRIICAI